MTHVQQASTASKMTPGNGRTVSMILVAALGTNFRQGRLGMIAAALLLLASQSSLVGQVVYLSIPGAVGMIPGGINNLGFISGTFYPGTLFLSPIGFGPRGFITTVHG